MGRAFFAEKSAGGKLREIIFGNRVKFARVAVMRNRRLAGSAAPSISSLETRTARA
jgi:hypothetical protein